MSHDYSEEIPSLEGIPPDTLLPVAIAKEAWLDPEDELGSYKSKLAPAQCALLCAFQWLGVARKKALTEGEGKDSISLQALQQAVDEQVRSRGLWSESATALEDTTKSDLDEELPDASESDTDEDYGEREAKGDAKGDE
jgi:hypothetical protein